MISIHLIMKQQLKAKYPEWVNDKEQGKYNLCLSDDLDSYLSCAYLSKLFGYQITNFYDFKNIYENSLPKKPLIGIDIAIESGMTWDNHVVKISASDKVNSESANINAINGINRSNYFTKYAGSTLLQILSYYDVPLPKSREARLILLDIDSSYLGNYNSDFKSIHRRYMEQLELYDLIDILDEETSVRAFSEVRRKYNLNSKIRVNQNGILETRIDLASLQGLFDVDLKLSEESFIKTYEFDDTDKRYVDDKTVKPDVFSFALTSKKQFKYTV